MVVDMKKKSFLTLDDVSAQEIAYLLRLSAQLKAAKRAHTETRYLEGKQIALIFEKDSTRTRSSFEVAAYDQGAHVTYLGPNGSHIGYKESIKDTARVLGRMYDGIEYRGFGQHLVEELAEYSGVPVWNGLTDEAHPTQVLADLLTIQEHVQKPLKDVSCCFLGALHYNMADSLMIGAAKLGMDLRLAGPRSSWPTDARLELAHTFARQSGGRITVTDDAATAVEGCDIIYTDVWVSMGEPLELWGERIKEMLPYQVNSQLMALTQNPSVKFMHCLPAFHNTETKVGKELYEKYGLDALEVTEEVFESAASIVFDQAENRLHTIKAIMVSALGNL